MKINLPIETFLFNVIREHQKSPNALHVIATLLSDKYLVQEELTDDILFEYANKFNNENEIKIIKQILLEWKTNYYLPARHNYK